MTEPPAARHLNVVVAGGAVDGHAIGRAVADAAAGRRCEVDRDLRDAGAGEVADRDVVGAAEGDEVDVLDAVEIHGDVADVAGELHPAVVGRDVDVLVDVGAVEHQRVDAGLAFDRVAAVARIPDEGVVAVPPSSAMSLPRPPVMMSLPSPPISVSLPSPPVMVSLPAPPSRVSWIRLARPLPAVKTSSPPLMLSTRFSVVPMSSENGAGLSAIEAHAAAVGGDREHFGAVAAVDLGGVDAVAAFDQVGAVARVPDHAVVAGLAEHLVVAGAAGQRVVAVAAEQQIVAALAEQGVVAGAAEQHDRCRSRRSACRCRRRRTVARRAARRCFRRARSCRCRPGRTPGSSLVLATVGCRPMMDTAPPLMRMLPAASRLATMVLSRLSPNTDSTPELGEKLALIAMVVVLSRVDESAQMRVLGSDDFVGVSCRLYMAGIFNGPSA